MSNTAASRPATTAPQAEHTTDLHVTAGTTSAALSSRESECCVECGVVKDSAALFCGHCGVTEAMPEPLASPEPEQQPRAGSSAVAGDLEPAGAPHLTGGTRVAALVTDTEAFSASLVETAPVTPPEPDATSGTTLRTRRRLWVLPVLAISACTVAGGIWATATITLAPPAPHPSMSTAPAPASTLPGWSGTPDWNKSRLVSTDAAVRGESVIVRTDGKRIAARTTDKMLLLSAEGDVIDSRPLTADARLLSASLDRVPAIAVWGAGELFVWAGDAVMPAVHQMPAGSTVTDYGDRIIVRTGEDVSVLTVAGLAPYVSPRALTTPLAVTPDGAMQWASSRGEVLTASAAGTLTATTVLVPPASGAVIDRWLAGGAVTVLVWALPDGSAVVAAHGGDGLVLAQQPLDPASAQSALVTAPDQTTSMLGPVRIDRATGELTVPDAAFRAATAIGSSFYGAQGAAPAVLTGTDIIAADGPVTVTPYGVTSDGALVATTAQRALGVYPAH